MTRVLVELAVDSLDGVRTAVAGGADRIELCAALELGGLTPSAGLAARARAATSLPILAILRPRAGDFVLAADDVELLCAEIERFRALGLDGFVAGALTPDAEVDRAAMRALRDAAAPLPLTFHRAFDLARDPGAALAAILELGLPRLLSSGGAPDAERGLTALASLAAQAGSRLELIAGGGVRRHNAARIARAIATAGAPRAIHLSAARTVDGPMRWRGAALQFDNLGRGPFERRVTELEELRATVAAVRD
ncbi:MAG: copper homeostasis protein CutC [Planctomycetes bacterium]|nr:copper homeostasis protein CutC [Planctomycetota bacterium]